MLEDFNGSKEEIYETQEEPDYSPKYDLIISPSDFNISTLFDSIRKGKIKIPGFQRNYVWDIRTASRFIESILMNLPIPQIFLFVNDIGEYIVIDGQQRLMTIYFFISGRFPKYNKRGTLRELLENSITIDEELLKDDELFDDFRLRLRNEATGRQSPFHNITYNELNDVIRNSFDFHSIRTIIIKSLRRDDTSVYEIFSRLNTGGVKLNYQEIRTSLYYSDFIKALFKMNKEPLWRTVFGQDIHPRMEDIEAILRGFAMLIYGEQYKPPMYGFLDRFCRHIKQGVLKVDLNYLYELFKSFLDSLEHIIQLSLKEPLFYISNKFSIILYEAVFVSVCEGFYKENRIVEGKIDINFIYELKNNKSFKELIGGKTTSKEAVNERLKIARNLLKQYPLK